MNLEPVAKAAILDGGLPALLALAGGTLKVKLLRLGVECSGNGYARGTVSSFAAAAAGTNAATKDSVAAAAFTAAGGSIVFDQVQIWNAAATVLYATSQATAAKTIAAGVTHNVTVRFEIPALALNGPLTEAELVATLASGAAWKAYTASYGPLRLPPLTTLTAQLTLPYVVGGTVAGLGHSEPITPAHAAAGPVSDVIWGGARTGTTTMLRVTGQRTVFRDFNLHGATRAQIDAASVARVPRLLQIINDGAGLGTGGFIFQGVCFSYADLGINVSDVDSGANCDELTFDKCFFDRLTVGVRVNNNQGLSHVYNECHIRDTPIFIDVKSGGHFTLKECEILSPLTVFSFAPSGVDIEFGPNACSYNAIGLKVDSQAVNARIVNMAEHNPYYSDIYCERIHFPAETWTNPAFTISGKTSLHVVRCKNLQSGMFSRNNAASAQGLPYVHIDGCRLYLVASAADLFTGSGPLRVKVTNCYDHNNVAIADLNTTLA